MIEHFFDIYIYMYILYIYIYVFIVHQDYIYIDVCRFDMYVVVYLISLLVYHILPILYSITKRQFPGFFYHSKPPNLLSFRDF